METLFDRRWEPLEHAVMAVYERSFWSAFSKVPRTHGEDLPFAESAASCDDRVTGASPAGHARQADAGQRSPPVSVSVATAVRSWPESALER